MQTKVGNVARYKIIAGSEGNRYQFFCELSGALVCTSEPVLLDSPEQELRFAWESEGKKHFNKCQKCGKWISDTVYNVETLECVECSPWEEEPSYCPHCGEQVQPEDVFCTNCQNRLRYGMDRNEEKCKTDRGRKFAGGNAEKRMSDMTGEGAAQKHGQVVRSDPYEFGYGPRAMMEAKVCSHCGNTDPAERYSCSTCGGRLPKQTIYQIYQSKHKKCSLCDTVLAPYMHFCPHCGMQIDKTE